MPFVDDQGSVAIWRRASDQCKGPSVFIGLLVCWVGRHDQTVTPSAWTEYLDLGPTERWYSSIYAYLRNWGSWGSWKRVPRKNWLLSFADFVEFGMAVHCEWEPTAVIVSNSVDMVDSFIYLGSHIRSHTVEMRRRWTIVLECMTSLYRYLWKSGITTATPRKSFDILTLYKSDYYYYYYNKDPSASVYVLLVDLHAAETVDDRVAAAQSRCFRPVLFAPYAATAYIISQSHEQCSSPTSV